MDVIRHSKSSKFGLLGAAISAGYTAYNLGKAAYANIKRDDKDRKFVTWTMPKGMKRRLPTRRRYRPSVTTRSYSGLSKRLVRKTSLFTTTIAPGAAVAYDTRAPQLSQVQTSDLTAIYRLYRLRKVVCYATPRIDPGNSGLLSNQQMYVGMCCDPELNVAPSSLTEVTAYDNHRAVWINAGRTMKYTFYPKAVNSIDVAGTATGVGSYAMNPWIRLDATGITVGHRSLRIFANTGAVAAASNPISLDYYFEYHFDVKGIA